MRFVGTEAVVHDIDFMSKAFDGDDAPVNYFGTSYGSLLGQYLVQILPPERIGRVGIDGILDPEQWSKESTPLSQTREVGPILQHFADTCASAGSACALAPLSSTRILAQINRTLDSLYAAPPRVTTLGYPAYMDAGILRSVLFNGLYNTQDWPVLAELLAEAFAGNYTRILRGRLPAVDPADGARPDTSLAAELAIACNDAAPENPSDPATVARQKAEQIAQALEQNSPQVGESPFAVDLCAYLPEVQPSRSRYGGAFGFANGTLHTPILILSQTYDPVTPFSNALSSLERLGSNARLIHQAGGYGHTVLAQLSDCAAGLLQAYFVDGAVPESSHTVCQVDEQPFGA